MRLEIEVQPNGCWLWKRGCDSAGYGVLYPDKRTPVYAHRFMYEAAYGAIPEGLTVDHTCTNHPCINPGHLEAIPHIINVQRGNGQKHPVISLAANRFCVHGHWMDEANTYNHPSGKTHCRKCHAERKRLPEREEVKAT